MAKISMLMTTDIYQIFYDENSLKNCYQSGVIYVQNDLNRFFENQVIADIVPNSTSDFTAVISHKFSEKLQHIKIENEPLSPDAIQNRMAKNDIDVLSFFNRNNKKMLLNASTYHEHFELLFTRMIEMAKGLKITMKTEFQYPVYQNHFVARTSVYQDYVNNWLIPCMDALDSDQLKDYANADANYSHLKLNPQIDAIRKNLIDKIGLSYYPHTPFVLERLFSFYLHCNRGLKVCNL